MLKLFSLFLFSLLLIYSCSQYSETPVSNSPNGDIKVKIRVNGIGTIGKRSAITLEKLYVIVSGFSSDTIRDSFDPSGMETQTISATFNDLPSHIKSTLYAYTVDSIGKIIHRGLIYFLMRPDQTTIVKLDLSPEYSILFSNFYPFKNIVNKYELFIDYEKVVDTSFQKQTLPGDTVTLTNDSEEDRVIKT